MRELFMESTQFKEMRKYEVVFSSYTNDSDVVKNRRTLEAPKGLVLIKFDEATEK